VSFSLTVGYQVDGARPSGNAALDSGPVAAGRDYSALRSYGFGELFLSTRGVALDSLSSYIALRLDAARQDSFRAAGEDAPVRVAPPIATWFERNTLELRTGFEWNYYSAVLSSEIIEFLSPWAFDSTKALTFGGRAYRSVLLDFVEEREYVDYVSDFKLFADSVTGDVDRVSPATPDAILVSAPQHEIRPLS
jgi:hypothetical protein